MISQLSPDLFPVPDPNTVDRLHDPYRIVHVSSDGNARYAFNLVLPHTWTKDADVLDSRQAFAALNQLANFREKPTVDSAVIAVFCADMPVEVDIVDWIKFQADTFKTTISFCKRRVFLGGDGVDVGGIYGPPDDLIIVRLTAIAEATRIFVIAGMAPKGRFFNVREEIALATHFFRPELSGGSSRLEQWFAASAESPKFEVGYPSSFIYRPLNIRINGKSAVDIFLLIDGNMAAYLRVKAIDTLVVGDLDFQKAFITNIDELTEGGVATTGHWLKDDDQTLLKRPALLDAVVGIGLKNKQEVEIRFAVCQQNSLCFAITLISVTPETDKILWMRSKRAYQIAVLTARRPLIDVGDNA